MIETLPDGTTLAYVDADWNPVSREEAVWVIVTKPDGTHIVAQPVRDSEGEESGT
jgi:hypothetical protein